MNKLQKIKIYTQVKYMPIFLDFYQKNIGYNAEKFINSLNYYKIKGNVFWSQFMKLYILKINV